MTIQYNKCETCQDELIEPSPRRGLSFCNNKCKDLFYSQYNCDKCLDVGYLQINEGIGYKCQSCKSDSEIICNCGFVSTTISEVEFFSWNGSCVNCIIGENTSI